jgi:hypothetical protein
MGKFRRGPPTQQLRDELAAALASYTGPITHCPSGDRRRRRQQPPQPAPPSDRQPDVQDRAPSSSPSGA